MWLNTQVYNDMEKANRFRYLVDYLFWFLTSPLYIPQNPLDKVKMNSTSDWYTKIQ